MAWILLALVVVGATVQTVLLVVVLRRIKAYRDRFDTLSKLMKGNFERALYGMERKLDDEAQWVRDRLLMAEGENHRVFQLGMAQLRDELFKKGSDFNVRRLAGTYEDRLRRERERRA